MTVSQSPALLAASRSLAVTNYSSKDTFQAEVAYEINISKASCKINPRSNYSLGRDSTLNKTSESLEC